MEVCETIELRGKLVKHTLPTRVGNCAGASQDMVKRCVIEPIRSEAPKGVSPMETVQRLSGGRETLEFS